MAFAGDRRAQSVQVGVIVLFGFLLLAYSGYQATVVPQQNERVEFEHSDRVQADMTDLRSAILDVATRPATRSVSVKLGTTYPSRSIFLNPNPPTGRLSTVDTAAEAVNVSIEHAESTDDEVGDFWNGDERTYNTGGIAYQPFYNYYDESAPVTSYENTVLSNQYADTDRPVSGQVLVDGRQIRLVTLSGSMTEEGFRSGAVDVRGVSASETRVTVTNDGRPINVSLRTGQSNGTWSELLADEIAPDGYITDITYDDSTSPARLYLAFEPDEEYDLSLTRVGVGSDVERSGAAYLTTVAGDGATIPRGTNHTLTAEVRDELNNPVSGEELCADVTSGQGTVHPSSKNRTTGSNGQASFVYEAPNGRTDATVQVSNDCGSDADPTLGPDDNDPNQVLFDVEVYLAGGDSGSGNGNGNGSP